MKYHCEAYNLVGTTEQRIGGFVVEAATMSEALTKAGKNIEVAIRPDQYRVTVTLMKE